MNRDKWFAVNYLALVSVLTLITTSVLRAMDACYYPKALFVIPLFFVVMLGVMFMIRRSCTQKGRDRAFFFLGYRIAKMLLAIVFLLVYFAVVRENLLVFAIILMAYYIAIMIFETVHFVRGEKVS